MAEKNRYPFLVDNDIRSEMHAYLGGTCKKLDCPVLIVGGVADHVHILCALTRNCSLAKVIGEMKRESSKWIKTKGEMFLTGSGRPARHAVWRVPRPERFDPFRVEDSDIPVRACTFEKVVRELVA